MKLCYLAFATAILFFGLFSCEAPRQSETKVLEQLEKNQLSAAEDNESTHASPVYDGPRLRKGNPILKYEAAAADIISTIYGDAANRVFRQGWLAGDSARFQLVEDYENKYNIYHFDYAQTGGDFSQISFPQIGKSDVVYEVHRDYFFKSGKLFFVDETIFTTREDGHKGNHNNNYIIKNGEIISWYRDKEKYQIAEQFYSVADNLFPLVNGTPILDWAAETFADPVQAMEGFENLEAEGNNKQMAVENMINQMVESTSVITSGKRIGWKNSEKPVIWLEFGPGRTKMGAAYELDVAVEGNKSWVYDAALIGIAHFHGSECKTLGDVVVTIDWAKRTKQAFLLDDLIHPKGLIYGDPSSEEIRNSPDTKVLLGKNLTLENIPQPLSFGSYSKEESFDEDGFAVWQWWLPGSAEKIFVQKTDDGIYWRGFEGAYH